MLSITGRAPDQLVFERDGQPLVDTNALVTTDADAELRADSEADRRAVDNRLGRSRFEDVERVTHAKQALRQAGYPPSVAKRAVESALAHVSMEADLNELVLEALRRCR